MKNVHPNSINAYLEIKRNNLLPRVQMEVYDCIANHGPITRDAVLSRLGLKTHHSGRFTELKNKGVIEECGNVKNWSTGVSVVQYRITENLPKKPPRSKKKQALLIIRVLKCYNSTRKYEYSLIKELEGLLK